MVAEQPHFFVPPRKPCPKAPMLFQLPLFFRSKKTYDRPEEWKELVDMFLSRLPEIMEKLGGHDAPLIWTADFMLDWDENGNDSYVLGRNKQFMCWIY